eukprot:219140-Pelagomonas_calceolata.AAC.8
MQWRPTFQHGGKCRAVLGTCIAESRPCNPVKFSSRADRKLWEALPASCTVWASTSIKHLCPSHTARPPCVVGRTMHPSSFLVFSHTRPAIEHDQQQANS